MNPWTIVLIAVGALILLIAFILTFGKARLKITVQDDVRAVLSLFGLRIWFYPERGFDLSPRAQSLRLWLVRRRKRRKKLKKQRRIAAGKPTLNLLDDLQVIFTILKLAYEKGKGKINLRIKRFHIRVATGDPAQTAILWGSVVGTSSTLLQWIDTNFNTVERRRGAINVYPDYLGSSSEADVRIEAQMPAIPFLIYIAELFSEYEIKRLEMRRRAKRRLERKKARAARRTTQTETI